MHRRSGDAGFSILQALMAMAVVVIAGMASVETLVLTNRKAASMRALNNARAVVQRNIDIALAVPFTASSQPAILVPTAGTLYDEDGDGSTNVKVVLARNGIDGVVNGNLTRIVTQVGPAGGPDIRKITFRLDYYYRSRLSSFSMTTVRATD